MNIISPIDIPVSEIAQNLRSPLKKKNFPYKNALAIAAILGGNAFPELKPSPRSVLAYIARLAKSGNPTSPTWAFKETIATSLGTSRPTVNRALKVLTDAGLIERLDQEKKRYNGRFFYARIALTEKACKALDLISCSSSFPIHQEPSTKPFTPIAAPQTTLRDPSVAPMPFTPVADNFERSEAIDLVTPPSINLSHGRVNLPTEDHNPQSIQKQSHEASGQSLKPVADKPFYQIPSELLWLIEMRLLTPPQLFLLMREYGEQKNASQTLLRTSLTESRRCQRETSSATCANFPKRRRILQRR